MSRSIKKGTIKQIKRGLYALVDKSTDEIYANKFQIASKLFEDSFFSYHEALEYYGLATQSYVSSFNYLSHTYTYDIIFNGIVFSGKRNNDREYIQDKMEEEGVRVVTLERAIVDSIDNLSLAGGLEEVEYALSNVHGLNIEIIKEILLKRDKAFLFQKVGYFFDKHFGNTIPSSFYDLCLSKKSNKIRYLNCYMSKAILNKKRNLMVEKEKLEPNSLP